MARFTFLVSLAALLALAVMAMAGPVIHPDVVNKIASGKPTNIFITMRDGTERVLVDISHASFATAGDKRTGLYNVLRQHAEASQAPLMSILSKSKSSDEIKSFWITNQLFVRNADASVLELLLQRDDVARVDKEDQVQLDPIDVTVVESPMAVDYNLERIRVEQVWANGVNGTGVVVGNIDTGVRSTHQALRGSYKNDDYSWFDPVTSSKTPIDDHTHGTMTMALMAGGLDVGVAYGVKWMACKGLNAQGVGDQSDLLACGQFILCPTTPDGKDPDCTQAPTVVSNSWNSVDPTGTWFWGVIDAWQAAGIIPVWSAGNYGERGCSSLGSHAPHTVIAVGATGPTDRLSYFSSQGPSPFDDKLIKPEVTAPGETVRSAHSQSDTTYAQASGTSMAAPHVAGVIALVLGMNPAIDYTQAKAIIEATASTSVVSTGAVCNGQPDSVFPNFQYGHGRLDAFAAYECVMNGNSCLGEPTTTTTTTTTTTEATPTTITIITPTQTTSTTTMRTPN